MTEETFVTPYGTFSVSETTDKRSYDRFKNGIYYQEDEAKFLQKFITPQSIVVDIGAHIGVMTLPFSIHAKEVHSFEPVEETRKFLERNIVLSNRSNVQIYPYALGAVDAREFAHSESAIDAAQYTVSAESRSSNDVVVDVRTLDSFLTAADLIKVDAEGMEMAVLRGASHLIERCHPTIFCEINFGQLWAHHTSPREVEKFLRAKGYTLYVLLGDNQLGKVINLSLMTGLDHPAFFLGIRRNHAFDILAAAPGQLPAEIEVVSGIQTAITFFQKKILPRIFKISGR